MITESRNKMTFERLKYYRHLGGGALECIASRLSKTPKSVVLFAYGYKQM